MRTILLLAILSSAGIVGCSGDDAGSDPSDDPGDEAGDGDDGGDDPPVDEDGGEDGDDDQDQPPPPECGEALADSIEASEAMDGALDASSVYFLGRDSASEDLRVHAVERERGQVELLTSISDPASITGGQLLVDEESLYVGVESGLWRAPIGGGSAEQLSADEIEDLAQDATHLYWTTLHPGGGEDQDVQLKRLAKEGGAEEILVDRAPGDVSTIALFPQVAVDATHVYWNNDLGEFLRMPTGGGEIEVFENRERSGDDIRDMVFDGQTLHWLSEVTIGGTPIFDFFFFAGGVPQLVTRASGGRVSRRITIAGDFMYYSHLDNLPDHGTGLYRVYRDGGDPDRLDEVEPDAFVPADEGIYVSRGPSIRRLPAEGCPPR